MGVTVSDIVSQMRASLLLADPDLDTGVGSTARKILDAVAETIAGSYLDQYLLDYSYDIDAKVGADLDTFVNLFGFTRFAAKRATGTVTFERTTSATTVIIPIGSQLATEDAVPVIVATIVPAMMLPGDTTIDVPVQAVVAGAASNLTANAIRRRVTPLEGVTSFTNEAALTGGADAESDDQLRLRFKRTVFRNLAGTEQMFLGVSLDDEAVTQANVLGPSKKRREQIEVVTGSAVSTAQDTAYIYGDSGVMGADIDSGVILTPGIHYELSTNTPPVVTVLDPTAAPDGIYDLEYEYVSTASRNDPENGITNRIDIWVSGSRPTLANEVLIFRNTQAFDNTVGSTMNVSRFLRSTDSPPVVGNFFVRFAFAPVISPSTSGTLSIGGQTYVEGTHFWLVNDVTSDGGAPDSPSGIEIRSLANGGSFQPSDGAIFTAEYVYNAVPADVERAIRAWRLITTDVRVHAAKILRLHLYLAVIYSPGFTETTVRPSLEASLSDYIARVGFNGVIQVSDLLTVAHQVNGIDAVRFLTSADDASHYAIQRENALGTTIATYDDAGTPKRAIDVPLGDDELASFNAVTLVQKAQNTMHSI